MADVTPRDVLLQTQAIESTAGFYEGLGMTRFLHDPKIIGLEGGGLRLFLEQAPPLGPVFEFFVPDLQAAKGSPPCEGLPCRG